MRLSLEKGAFVGAASAILGGGSVATAPVHSWPWFIGICSIALGTGTLLWAVRLRGIGLHHFLRGRNQVRKAISARMTFESEAIGARELVASGAPIASGKTFKDCIIRGPGRVVFVDRCLLGFCSSQVPVTQVPEGHGTSDAIGFYGCEFERCYFENLTIVMTPGNFAQMAPNIQVESRATWEAKQR